MKKTAIIAWLVSTFAVAHSANWPAWRGPHANGLCDESDFPVRWSGTDGIRWKTPLPAPGNSTPIVWGGKVFITCAIDKGTRRTVMCFDRANGRMLWQKELDFTGTETTHRDNPFCSASPVTDGTCVVAWHGSAGLVAYDLDGRELWRRTDLGPCDHIWGNASSPVIHGQSVLLYFGPGLRCFLAALDKKTGKDLWRVDLPEAQSKLAKDYFGAWDSPVIRESGARAELLLGVPRELRSYDPRTGTELWRCAGLGPLVYNDPVFGKGDVIVATSGYHGPAMAVRDGGQGDVTSSRRLWHHDGKNPQRVGSGVIVGDHFYILDDSGFAQCLELASGKEVWHQDLHGKSWSSMACAGDRLYAIDMKGTTHVLAASPGFRLLQQNPLGEMTRASPAFSDGAIFIRTYQHLYCIGK